MLIIGEKLNTSIEMVQRGVESRDVRFIADLARVQVDAGADYIDVNCGTFVQGEPEILSWMVNVVQTSVDRPLCIDSPNPEAIGAALETYRGDKPIINSITAEGDRYDDILPLVVKHKTSVVALCMDEHGIPDTVDGRVKVAKQLVDCLVKDGVPVEDIYVDPMIQPVATDHNNGIIALDTILHLKSECPNVNTICGLSNISFGLPARKIINRAFLVLAINAGLDAAILDPLDEDMMQLYYAAKLLSGQDEFCLGYIEAYRRG